MNKKYKININTINKIIFVMVIGIVTGNAGTAMAEEYSNIKTDTVCFNSTYNGNVYNITGTIFYKSVNPSNPITSNLIIAIHGFVNDRNVWNGGFLGPDKNSYARILANEGYVVITYDRLGYGQSKINFPGAGFTIDSEVQLQNLRDIIIQIKNGSNSCSSTKFKFDKIILIGHSGGAAIIESYAALYHDVDAIIPMTPPGPPGFEMNAEFYNNIINKWIIPQIMNGNDYVTMFPPGSNGISQDCLHFFFDPDNANPKISNTYCANDNLMTSPSGEYLSALEFWGKTHGLIPQIEKNLPVLLIFADNDLLFNESQKAERNYWKQYCNCSLSILRTETGHMLMFHRSSKDTIEYIIDWLHDNDLR
jgi:pimeloyl-ACP methyl ester carboxylesterase